MASEELRRRLHQSDQDAEATRAEVMELQQHLDLERAKASAAATAVTQKSDEVRIINHHCQKLPGAWQGAWEHAVVGGWIMGRE